MDISLDDSVNLANNLRAAFTGQEPYTRSERKFLPLSKLHQLIRHDSVSNHLRACHSRVIESVPSGHPLHGNPDKYISIAQYVCGATEDSCSTRKPAKKIFAILLAIEKVPSILDFMRHDIRDDSLPFTKTAVDGANFDLAIENGAAAMPVFSNWSQPDKSSFEANQWCMLSPILEPGDNVQRFRCYNFKDELILPFLTCKRSGYKTTSTVWQVDVDPEHHKFNQSSNVFALKQLHADYRGFYVFEKRAFEKIPPHRHLTPLYSAIEHKDYSHLLLPWATGLSLQGLWDREPELEKTESVWRWFAEQCFGLAEALSYIHDTDLTEPGVTLNENLYPEDDKTCGRHGDIKPTNVLCFQNDTNGTDCGDHGILKICDFGLTRFHHPGTTQVSTRHVNATMTYRPPEFDINEKISRPYDVWSLGCLYLEFITWLLLGGKAVDKFSIRRMRECAMNPNIRQDNFFNIWKREPRMNHLAVSETGEEQARLSSDSLCSSESFDGSGETRLSELRWWIWVKRAIWSRSRRPHPEVKRTVYEWYDKLRSHKNCSPFLKDLLSYIEKRMLVVKPDKRAKCGDVVKATREMFERCKNETRYMCNPSVQDS